MRRAARWLAAVVLCGCSAGARAAEPTHVALIATAKQAPLKLLDGADEFCDSDKTIEAWLKDLVGSYARKITWTGGQCELVNTPNPLDVKSWPYCAQATITLVHPKAQNDQALVEIYMEEPKNGRPGEVYAFRSVMLTKDDGPDLERHRYDFQSEWDDRFPPPEGARCSND